MIAGSRKPSIRLEPPNPCGTPTHPANSDPAANNGYVFATGGDGFAAAFQRTGDATLAAENAQAALAELTADGASRES